MTCHQVAGGYVCVSPWGRLHVRNRYIWVEFHEYTGPTFFEDAAGTRVYEPKNTKDPVWPAFNAWLKRFHAKKYPHK